MGDFQCPLCFRRRVSDAPATAKRGALALVPSGRRPTADCCGEYRRPLEFPNPHFRIRMVESVKSGAGIDRNVRGCYHRGA